MTKSKQISAAASAGGRALAAKRWANATEADREISRQNGRKGGRPRKNPLSNEKQYADQAYAKRKELERKAIDIIDAHLQTKSAGLRKSR